MERRPVPLSLDSFAVLIPLRATPTGQPSAKGTKSALMRAAVERNEVASRMTPVVLAAVKEVWRGSRNSITRLQGTNIIESRRKGYKSLGCKLSLPMPGDGI
ncbi:hypothetical protein AAFF_G00189310 [Aldrovandia affinis]|uniref:Uncharacterized protein n=1 Tax=Aldrovandia affinis TaxID=143900 RepID=A0AAD7RJU3_9TELE|nr:hypothetical protein AAFF_G00189310 [Aldrovandia affinis]